MVTSASLPPRIAASARTFAMAPAADDASKAAVPIVEQRLRTFGYQPDANPDLLIEVDASVRARGVGAFTPDTCNGAPAWPERPLGKRLIGGGYLLGLRVRVLDAKSHAPLYESMARLRGRAASPSDRIRALAAAVLPTDPRTAPTASPNCASA